MLIRAYLGLVLLAATPAWSQLEFTPFQTATAPSDESQMLTPPPVSGEAYPTMVGSETRSNYLDAGLIFNAAYNDNVLPDNSATPVRDATYSVLPTLTINQITPRQRRTLTYTPGFTFYQHTSALNAADHNAIVDFQYRLSQHTTINFRDSFQKSSNVFNQAYPFSGVAISGSQQSLPPEAVAPYANRLYNTASGGISYQFGLNRMVGAGVNNVLSDYPNPTEAPGLYNSRSLGISVFYNHRLSSTQYVGLTYQYVRNHSDPVDAHANPLNTQIELHTHTLLPFYTIYFNPTLSLSLSAGSQYFDASQLHSLPVRSWAPSVMTSIGWQKSRANFVASYSRTVTGGVGLPGVFNSNNANASVRLQIARAWVAEAIAAYSINKNVTPSFSSFSSGGHTVTGTISFTHAISEHFQTEAGYVRLHQSYGGIAVISAAPDSNREYITISYHLTRPLGR